MKSNLNRYPGVQVITALANGLLTVVTALGIVIFNFLRGKYYAPIGMLFARVQYGEMIADMRGKINGSVHSRNRSGAYMRNKVTPVNPQTTYQTTVRNRLTGRAQAWRGLTQPQRDAWNSAVSNFKKTNIFGQIRTPSGINLYNRINMNLLNISEAVVATPPLPESVQALTTLSVAADDSANTVILSFTPVIDANSKMIVEATEPLSAGIDFVKSEFRQIDVLDNADTSPVDLSTAYVAKFGSTPPAGAKIFVRCTMVDISSGINGIPLKASTITVA